MSEAHHWRSSLQSRHDVTCHVHTRRSVLNNPVGPRGNLVHVWLMNIKNDAVCHKLTEGMKRLTERLCGCDVGHVCLAIREQLRVAEAVVVRWMPVRPVTPCGLTR